MTRRRSTTRLLALWLAVLATCSVSRAEGAGPDDACAPCRELEAIAAAAQPPGRNGWPDLARALEILASVKDEFPDADLDRAHEAGHAGALRAEYVSTEAALSALVRRGTFEAVHGAVAEPNIVRPVGLRNELLLDEHVGPFRDLTRAGLLRVRGDLGAGRADMAARTTRDLLALSARISCQASLFYRIVAEADRALVLDGIERGLARGEIPPETCRALLAVLLESRHAPFDVTVRGEAVRIRQLVEYLHADGSEGAERRATFAEAITAAERFADVLAHWNDEDEDDQPAPAPPPLSAEDLPSREQMQAAIDAVVTLLADEAARPRPERVLRRADVDAALRFGREYGHIANLGPALARALDSSDAGDLRQRGTAIMLAIELHRVRTGGYPRALAELAPFELDVPPVDPFTGRPFGYRRSDGGNAYQLYSVGADGTDDGGRPSDPPHRALVDPTAAGTDYRINDR